jgi:hypothetical protein
MPTEIKLWRIEGERPRAIPQDKLDLESRVEEWLREDIGLVSDDLLLIGQQVPTAYGGVIDLLAIDPVGNLVILELKRDRTPRDIVAQVLDYASWVQGLSHLSIEEIANAFIKNQPLEQAFREKFQTDLPDVLNERHRMYVVATSLDSSTERIVKYLSATHGLDINIATFAYFKTPDGELLGRSLLLDEAAVQIRAESTSKRKSPRSLEEFRGLAEKNGVVELYDKALIELRPLFDGMNRTRSSVYLVGHMGPNKARNAILAIYPEASSAVNGLAMLCLVDRASEYFSLSQDEIRAVCGPQVKRLPVVYPDHVYYFDDQHLEQLIGLLRGANDQ